MVNYTLYGVGYHFDVLLPHGAMPPEARCCCIRSRFWGRGCDVSEKMFFTVKKGEAFSE